MHMKRGCSSKHARCVWMVVEITHDHRRACQHANECKNICSNASLAHLLGWLGGKPYTHKGDALPVQVSNVAPLAWMPSASGWHLPAPLVHSHMTRRRCFRPSHRARHISSSGRWLRWGRRCSTYECDHSIIILCGCLMFTRPVWGMLTILLSCCT